MRVAFLHAPSGHYAPLMTALEAGVFAEGDRYDKLLSPNGYVRLGPEYDAAVCWGWRLGEPMRRFNPHVPVLIMERGYVGDRFHWTSLGWNGLNGRAVFPKPAPDVEGKISRRWIQNFGVGMSAKPWRDPSARTAEGLPGYALILGQVQNDAACKNVNLALQYRTWYDFLKRRGHTVKFRPHPKAVRNTSKLAHLAGLSGKCFAQGTLAEDLAGAKFTVSWNSNSSVDSILAGVPSVTLDEGAMAWPVTSHSLETPVTMPSRTEWAAQLAWCQWQPSELADGTAWRAVKEAMPR